MPLDDLLHQMMVLKLLLLLLLYAVVVDNNVPATSGRKQVRISFTNKNISKNVQKLSSHSKMI